MSLIQAALNKTQKAPAQPETTKEPISPAEPVQKLQAYEAQIEEQISKTSPQPQTVRKENRTHWLTGRLAVLVSLLLVTAAVYLFQPQPGNWTPPAQNSARVGSSDLEESLLAGKMPAIVSIPSRSSKKDFELSGIIWDGNDPFAVLNNQIVRTGDWITKKARVTEIGRDFAIVEQDGKAHILKLPS